MRTPSSPVVRATTSDRPRHLLATPEPDLTRICSRAESAALFKRVVALTAGGGHTQVTLRSTWTASLRWARNRPITVADVTAYDVMLTRYVNGKALHARVSALDDARLRSAVQDLEQQLAHGENDPLTPEALGPQEYLTPPIWSEATYQKRLPDLSTQVWQSVEQGSGGKLVTAGYAELGAASWAIVNTLGLDAYAAVTGASYSETVRLPDGSGSGWAGESFTDWTVLDPIALSASARRDCLSSANPRALEPGRYTAILLPSIMTHFVCAMIKDMDRREAESDEDDPYHGKMGTRVFDQQLTITSDPMDPDGGYIPFDVEGNPYRKVTWIENGVLKELPYNRDYALTVLGTDTALPNPKSVRVQGGQTSVEEMIATTERGILVANSGVIERQDRQSMLYSGVTRNGLWLVEHGRVTFPIKNMWFAVSVLEVFAQILQMGPAQRTQGIGEYSMWTSPPTINRNLPTRVLNGGLAPAIIPAMKVQDFNFTRLTDAI